eukprot:PhM_4_TR13563/c2_g1_i1/m.29267
MMAPSTAVSSSNQRSSFWAIMLWITFQNSDDVFLDRVRKIVVTVLVPLGAIPPIFTIYFAYLIFSGAQDETFGLWLSAADCVLFVFTLVMPYVIARRRGKVEDWLMDALVTVLFTHWFIITACIPTYGNKTVSITIALMALVTQTKLLYMQMLMWYVVYNMDNFNQSYYRDGKAYFLVSGHRYGPPLEQFLGTLSAQCTLCMLFVAIHLQCKAHQKHVEESKAAVVLCQKVVNLLRQYDTGGVDETLSVASFGVDPALVQSLSAMNANLKTYKPFLPNYVFLSQHSDDDEEGNGLGGDEDTDDDGTGTGTRTPNDKRSCGTISCVDLDDSHSARSSLSRGSGRRYLARNGSTNRMMVNTADTTELGMTASTSTFSPQSQQPLGHPALSLNGRKKRISMALVETPQREADTYSPEALQKYVDTVHEAAKTTRGALHTMVGDSVSVTWGSTMKVAQSELKAAKFLLSLVPLKVGAAVFTGQAHFVSLLSSSQQHANLVLADWLCAAALTFRLARRYNVHLVCERTQSVICSFMDTRAVDVVRNVSVCDHDDGAVSVCNDPAAAMAVFTSRSHFVVDTYVYELVREFRIDDSNDDEWMYQLQKRTDHDDNGEVLDRNMKWLRALRCLAEGDPTAAQQLIFMDDNGCGDEDIEPMIPHIMLRRLYRAISLPNNEQCNT